MLKSDRKYRNLLALSIYDTKPVYFLTRIVTEKIVLDTNMIVIETRYKVIKNQKMDLIAVIFKTFTIFTRIQLSLLINGEVPIIYSSIFFVIGNDGGPCLCWDLVLCYQKVIETRTNNTNTNTFTHLMIVQT